MIKLEIEIAGSVLNADLLEEDAPLTCQKVLDVLPVEGEVSHVRWSGGTIMARFPNLLSDKLGIENGTIYGAQGDVMFIDFRRPGYVNKNYQQFFIVYQKEGAQFRGWDGNEIVNRFAKIRDNLDELERIGEKVWKTGPKRIAIRAKP